MDTKRAFATTRQFLPKLWQGLGGRVAERLRHLIFATLFALGMIAVFLLEPIDQFLWLFQSKIAGQKPSGDIVYVVSDEIIDDPNLAHRRLDLAKALDELDRRGVGKVYVDIVFDEPSEQQFDQPLAQAIERLGPRIALADQMVLDANDKQRFLRTDPAISGTATRVVADRRDSNYFGIAWIAQYGFRVDGKPVPSLGAALGGVTDAHSGNFQIDYGFAAREIATYPFSRLSQGAMGNSHPLANSVDFAGKTVVIGYDRQTSGSSITIPNSVNAPSSYVSIYAGETLKSGRVGFLSSLQVIAIMGCLMACLIILAPARRRRWIGYAAIVGFLPVMLVLAARMGVRVEASYAIGLFTVYALFRSRARWKRWVALVNQDTGLPTLKALEARLMREHYTSGHVVVAKVHNYERILKTLRAEDRTTYLLKLIDRLRAADPNLAVFSEGHYVAWHSPMEDSGALTEHLAGLRAIFAAPVSVADTSIDVGITFGMAALEGDSHRRVPAAIAAAEETTEAHDPIKLAESSAQSDLLWDISLRARIDEAMDAGEIYCVYQPKIHTGTGDLAGVEALVRWHDPAKGFIEPMHFVQQCEKAGRMEHLTRYVLQSACSAGQLLHFRGTQITMSVNISATLLGDMRVVGLVRNALQATRFDPRFLVLEITETSRIADMQTAATILEELSALGVKLSIDDFGVGAANFETFFSLPFDELKIDRLFVSNITTDPKARAIVSSIVEMGHQARITVVAEGVETLREAEILNEIGCDELQGYAFSRPISLSKLMEYKGNHDKRQAANMV
ncbi:EAL domain-containing protein [Qipengyuania sp. 6B39]|uniref:EAL domain-containing protein n=1 Tax=Qipengyuania proteolytica TaxID=2867239 RepID=UPI001C895F16|nr:EAL domain-containing protein [Qipengyuania proteolytica]MBX7496861.1 EAL domain-containing protein [Qipengyuania proteolytica]